MALHSSIGSAFGGLVIEAVAGPFCRCVETWKTSAALFQAGFYYTGSNFKAPKSAMALGLVLFKRSKDV